jgi:hypothetical protein
MAATATATHGWLIASPGTPWGPCYDCDHDECQKQRAQAAQHCPECGEPIGYVTLYSIESQGVCHNQCCGVIA